MTLKDSFKTAGYQYEKAAPGTLRVTDAAGIWYFYDFNMRLMTAKYGEGLSTEPFSQLDREMLVEMRDKLVSLGGTPPELPAETQTGPQKPRALNP